MQWITLPRLSEYNETIANMEEHVQGVIAGKQEQAILLVEHSEVYTAGSSANESDLLVKSDIPVVHPGRGGKYTYHGPGQRVVYPILDLKQSPFNSDLKKYVRFLQQWMINVLATFGLKGKCFDDAALVGVWVETQDGPRKIAAIGIRVKKWVSYHGVAFNINTDLEKYKAIVPCGISHLGVTSLLSLGIKISMEQFDQILQQEFDKLISEWIAVC